MKKYSKKSKEKRNKERESYPAFYKKHVDYIRDNNVKCRECGVSLIGDVSEVAHILPKGSFPSVATEDINIVYLCGWKQNGCHTEFDNRLPDYIKNMSVYPEVNRKFLELESKVEEKINYKIYDKYTD